MTASRALCCSVVVLAALASFARVAAADDARAQLRLGSQPHAGLPFEIQLIVEGLDQAPQPDQPKLTMPGAQVTPLGASPQVSQSIQIINGRRTESMDVRWVFRYRVRVDAEGPLHVPSLSVVQGSKRATAPAGDVDVDAVAATDDMKLELHLPDRPVFVGETVPITLVWLFRRQPDDQTFTVPMLALDDFTVSEPVASDPQRAVKFAAGGKDLALPYTVDAVDVGGTKFNRISFTFYAAPRKVGKVAIPASTVVAPFAVGRGDVFGRAPTKMFRAADIARTLEVKPLPETDRPAGFAGAVGSAFSIAARTSRSVVQVGEPVELTISVKSDQRLDLLSLGNLAGPGGLPKDKFTVPADAPTGELSEDGKTKTFKVTATLIAPTTEVPALELAYFDPVKGSYQTAHSDPIALSVKGGTTISASDVVAATPRKPAPTSGSGAAAGDGEVSLVGADLALSTAGSDDRPLGGTLLWILVGLLYAVPIAVFAARRWQLRTASQREDAAEVRLARRRVEDELTRAATAPARDAAGPLGAGLRALARALELSVDGNRVLATLETESFAPSAATQPLSPDVRADADALMRKWLAEGRARAKKPGAPAGAGGGAAAVLVLIAIVGASAIARADASVSVNQGRGDYQDAMTITDPSARKAAFTRAAAALGDAARATPDRPELLTDWGNAALGAGDVATATLAYRRALALDGSNARARRNLAWLRGRQSDSFHVASEGAADTLFFFHQWPRARRLVVGAIAFALAVLLLVPWTGRRRTALAWPAVLSAAVWIAMSVSIVVEDRAGNDAVVMDSVVLRAADSAGAPAALTSPLPRGAEVTVLERRDAWTRVRVASGATGWLPGGAVEPVVAR